jgi:hypothetical protein
MPDTPTTAQAETEGSDGTSENPDYDWTKMSASIPDEQSARVFGNGTNAGTNGSFNTGTDGGDSVYGGFKSDLSKMSADLSQISSTPFSDAISNVASSVYGTTKSATSGLVSGNWGSAFQTAAAGSGRNNPDSKNYVETKSKSNVVNGKITKNANGNATRKKGNSSPTGGGASYR